MLMAVCSKPKSKNSLSHYLSLPSLIRANRRIKVIKYEWEGKGRKDEGRLRMNYINLYKGRIGQKNFALVFLFNLVGGIFVLSLLGTLVPVPFVLFLVVIVWCLLFWIPACVRRLHDTGMSGWFVLLFLVPVVNMIFPLALLLTKGKPEKNKYGDVPSGNTKFLHDFFPAHGDHVDTENISQGQ